MGFVLPEKPCAQVFFAGLLFLLIVSGYNNSYAYIYCSFQLIYTFIVFIEALRLKATFKGGSEPYIQIFLKHYQKMHLFMLIKI